MADVVVFVEVPSGSRNKYELDEKLGAIVLDRRLFTSMAYPADYGFIEGTLGEDGDPLDALVLVGEPTFPGCRIRARVVGVFHMADEKGPDEKIICVPLKDPAWMRVSDVHDIPAELRNEVEHFFQVYKDLEEAKVETRGYGNRAEAELVCGFIRGTLAAPLLLERFREATSPGFDPARDLQKIGLANQTTMLMTESLEIQELLRAAMRERWGEAELESRFRAFDTICSATQDRQDAVLKMLAEGGLDLMVVIGGYNSSNTQALTRICAERLPTFHISSADRIDGASIHHRPVGGHDEATTSPWLPAGPVTIGLTAGASTPNNVVGETVERILGLRGLRTDQLVAG